jgi:hypothetical protein
MEVTFVDKVAMRQGNDGDDGLLAKGENEKWNDGRIPRFGVLDLKTETEKGGIQMSNPVRLCPVPICCRKQKEGDAHTTKCAMEE